MKIGRNDQCPCGSGKKYKKCCLNALNLEFNNDNTVSIMDSASCFEYIEGTANAIEKIIGEYILEDVTRAIYCINAWAPNRSALAQSLTLNMALRNTREFGSKSIKEYTELSAFYNSIASYLPITHMEDLTLSDFGEVKIVVDGEVFPIILGTGHEQVFAAINFIPTLASVVKMKDDLLLLLRYNRVIIDALKDENVALNYENNHITFEIPSESFWESVNRLFDSEAFEQYSDRVFNTMGYQTCPIEMQHFFIYQECRHPLYNTSLLVDFYKKILSLASKKEFLYHINLTIGSLLENTFNFSDNTRSRVLIAPRIFDMSTGKPYTNNHLFFMTASAGKALIAINKGDFDNVDSLEAEIKAIKSLHENNRLRLCESYYRKELHGGYAVDVLNSMPVQLLLIEPFTDISAQGALFTGSADHFSCTALDLIYMLRFMDDFDELIAFIEYDRTKKAQIMAIGGKSNLFFIWKKSHRYIASGAIEYDMISVPYGTADDYVYEYYTNKLAKYPFSIRSQMFADPLSWSIREGDLGYTHYEHKGCPGYGGEGKLTDSGMFIFLVHNIDFFTEEDLEPKNHTALRTIDELNQRLFNRYGEALGALPFLNGKVLQVMYIGSSVSAWSACSI